MIIRVWRGWTAGPDATDAYERLLNDEIAPGIMRRGLDGLRELGVFRRVDGGGAEFLTLMTFDDRRAVTRFAGPDPAASVVPPSARELLSHHDERSRHYELLRRHLP